MGVGGWIIFTIFLAILATLVQIAGYVVPLWIWLEDGQFRVGVGLWYTQGCGIDGSCNYTPPDIKFGYGKKDTYQEPEFNAVRALETVGLGAGVILILFLVVYRVGYGSGWTSMGQLNLAAFFTCVLAWMSILVGLIVYCASYWPVVGTSPLISSLSWPWALLLCGGAAFLFIVVCVLIRLKCRDRSYVKQAVPTSGDSKMDLNPVTKHGIMHKYFKPLYYNENRRTDLAIASPDDVNASMDRGVVGSGERRMMALEGGAFENGVQYRYIPTNTPQNQLQFHNGDASHNERTVVRRVLPTAVLVYPGAHDDSHHGETVMTHAQTAGQEVSANQGAYRGVAYRNGDAGYIANGGVVGRDTSFQNGGGIVRDTSYLVRDTSFQNGGQVQRDTSYQNAGGLVRDTSYQNGGLVRDTSYQNGGPVRDASYQNGGVVTTTTVTRDVTYRGGESSPYSTPRDGPYSRDTDGRLNVTTANNYNVTSGYTATGQHQDELAGGVHTGVLLEHTNHNLTSGAPGPRVVLPTGQDKPYDPTFIYRPFAEQQQY